MLDSKGSDFKFSKEDLEIIENHIETLKNFGTILEIEKPKLNPVERMFWVLICTMLDKERFIAVVPNFEAPARSL